MGAEAGAPVVDDPARLDEQLLAVHGEVVGVGKLPAAVDVLVFAVDELAEEAFVPKLLQVHVLLCERVVLQEVVDLAGALDGLDQADALGGAAEGRHLAHDVLAPVQGLDGVGRVAREVGGDEDGVEAFRSWPVVRGVVELETTRFLRSSDAGDAVPASYPDAFPVHGPEQAAYDLHRIARSRENAAAILFDEAHALGLEPAPGISRAEMVQGAFHQLEPSRIDFPQVSDGVEGIGQVTASASGQRDLGQGLGSCFQHAHIGIRAPSFRFDGTQAAGRSDDGQFRHGSESV